jgi:predicted MFS family arabinose efflux permease
MKDGRSVRWALMFGNLVIGCGIMVAAGTLNDLARSLSVSVPVAGQIITVGGATVAFAAPLLAGWVAGFDRRKLLVWSLVGYAIGHALCAAMPSIAALLPMRALTVFGAAIFTPQAAAAVAVMVPPEERGRSIAFIFIGWSLASVIGLPLAAFASELLGWRATWVAIGVASLGAAAWVHAAMPDGVKPPAMGFAAWGKVFASPVLMAIVFVTVCSAAGQFATFSYVMPYLRDAVMATPLEASLFLAWFGAFGLFGNVLMTRIIDRLGTHLAATLMLLPIGASFLLWPLAGDRLLWLAAAVVPWAIGLFALNSAQQARLSNTAPQLAPALLALNTSAIYLGQAAGAASGGWIVAHRGYGPLWMASLAGIACALALSVWALRQTAGGRVVVAA